MDVPTLCGMRHDIDSETEGPNRTMTLTCKKSYRNINIQCSLKKVEPVNKISCGTQYEPAVLVSQEIQCSLSDLMPKITHFPLKRRVCAECIMKCSPETRICHVIPSSINRNCNEETRDTAASDLNCSKYYKQINLSKEIRERTNCSYPSTESCSRGLDIIPIRNGVHYPGRNETQSNQCHSKRRDNISSSSTSGIAETVSSRSEISQANEVNIYSNKNKKRRKKHLWNPPSDTNTISDVDDATDMNYGLHTQHKVAEKHSDGHKVTSVKVKQKYSTEEQLQIIKFIAEKNLFSLVGGVTIWHNMEAEMDIGRSWQSLKENFRKQILPNIEKYNLSSSVEKSFCEIRK